MKLRVMNCKNCNAPLRLSGDKLVCDFCNSAFDIEKDASDVAFENVANAEELIRRSLSDRKAEMEAFFKKKEEENIAKEQEAERRHQEFLRQMRRKARLRTLRSLITTAILCVAIFFTMKFIIEKSKERQATSKAQTEANTKRPISYRVVPSQLEKDDFVDHAAELVIAAEKEKHEGAVIESSKDIWNLVQEPEILEKYLVTSDSTNRLYFILKFELETKDGRTKEGYDCLYLEDFYVDEKGKLVFERDDDRVYGDTSDTYDIFWRLDFDRENMVKEAIGSKWEDEKQKNYFVFDLSDR